MTIPIPHWTLFWAVLRFSCWDGPRALWRGVRRHPKLWALFVALVGLALLIGPAVRWGVYAPVLLVPWAILHRPSFRHWIIEPARADWRRWHRYQRHWTDVTSLNRLSVIIPNGLDAHPEIMKVRCEDFHRDWHWQLGWPPLKITKTCTDHVWVRTLISQDLQDYQEHAQTIAMDYGARKGRAFPAPKGRVRFEFSYGPDPLAETIPALPIPERAEDIDLEAIPVGLMENRDEWTLPVLGSHTLVAGITKGGKSSLTWSLLRGLAPAIQEGRVIVWAIDPKGGMSLAPGRALFDRFCSGTIPEMVEVLQDAVRYMDARTKSLEGITDMHVPTVEQPFLLVIVDEYARISKYKGDKTSAIAGNMAVEALVNVGRAAGVGVWICTQSPLKEIVPARDEIPNRVGFRMMSRIYNNEVLGQDAWHAGARCSEIPRSLPGVAWIRQEDGTLSRVRSAFVPLDGVRELAAEYGRGPMLTGDDLPPSFEFDTDSEAWEDDEVLELVSGEVVDEEGWE